MKYEEIVDIIQNKRRFGQASGREVTTEMTKLLGFPEQGMRIIHIAGTNGKGSTAAFVSSILQAADFVVGQFTSPHLVCFRERIMVNGEMIPEEDVVRIGEKILSLPMKLECTMFDICLGMALEYFKEKNCDFVILETGLGGAKDSTAGISQVPLVCGFTNIGFDHTAILGDTLEKIAGEKAGILKRGTVAVIGKMDSRAKNVIEKRAAELQVPTRIVDNLLTKISTQKIGLNGVFQRGNGALAVGIVEALFNQERGYLLDKYQSVFRSLQEETCLNGCDGHCDGCEKNSEITSFTDWKNYVISQGLKNVKWPGRMEILQENPFVMVDGAHNPQGVEALFNSLQSAYPKEKFIFVMGVMADKDYISMVEQMLPLAEEFLTVTVESQRSLQGQELADELKKRGALAEFYPDMEMALQEAKQRAQRKNRKVIIFGSLYFVGEVKHIYETSR